MSSLEIIGAPYEGNTLEAIVSTPPPIPTPAWVLKQSPEWRFVVAYNDPTNASGKTSGTLTFLDRLAVNRDVAFTINDSAVASGDVPSDSPEVNILRVGGGNPFLWFNSRFLYGFRREGAGSPNRPPSYPNNYPWVIRFAGILDQLGRNAQSDQGVSHYTAHDPWTYWRSLPVITDAGALVGRGGWKLQDASGNPLRGDQIVVKLLTNTLTFLNLTQPGATLYADWGQTAFYGGTIEHTALVDFSIDQGMTLGDALTKLTDTGTIDLVLTPIYDIQVRPGLLVEVSIFSQAGSVNNGAIFAWNLPPRSLVGIDLLDDGLGTANRVQIFASSAKVPIPVQSPSPDSAATYGQWWMLKSISGTDAATTTAAGGSIATSAAELLAKAEANLRRQGKRSLTIDPTPERSPIPWNEYFVGDTIPVWASRERFGTDLGPGPIVDGAWSNPQRIYAIPIRIGDDRVETVETMLLTQPDFL